MEVSHGTLVCFRVAGISRKQSYPGICSVKSKTIYGMLTLSFVPPPTRSSPSALSVSALYFRGEENALSFTVGGGDGLQLQEVQQHLDLQGKTTCCRHKIAEVKIKACHKAK